MEAAIRVMLPQVKGGMGLQELEEVQRSSPQSLQSQPGAAAFTDFWPPEL